MVCTKYSSTIHPQQIIPRFTLFSYLDTSQQRSQPSDLIKDRFCSSFTGIFIEKWNDLDELI